MGGYCSTFTQTIYLDHFRCFKHLIKKGKNPEGFPLFTIILHDKVEYLQFAHEHGYIPMRLYLSNLHGKCLIYALDHSFPLYPNDLKNKTPVYAAHILSKKLDKDAISKIMTFFKQ